MTKKCCGNERQILTGRKKARRGRKIRDFEIYKLQGEVTP